MQEDQIGIVGSTLTRLSGGLSFQTARQYTRDAAGLVRRRQKSLFFNDLVLRWEGGNEPPSHPSGRQAEASVGRLPEEPFLNQTGEHPAALVRLQLEEPSCLLNGRREPTHLEELAAHARLDVVARTRGGSSAWKSQGVWE